MKKALVVKAICLTICIFSLAAKATDKKDNAELKEYRKIVEENKRYRSFPFAEGYPDATPFHKDEQGYIWFRKDTRFFPTDPENYKYFRFDGKDFDNVFENDYYATQDTVEGFIPLGKFVYMRGQHCVYRWEGSKCTRFLFPGYDQTLAFDVSPEKMICYGYKGYAELIGKNWKYYRYRKALVKNDYYKDSVVSNPSALLRYPAKLKTSSQSDTLLVIKNGIQSSFLIRHPGEKTAAEELEYEYDKNGIIWLNYGYQNWISSIDPQTHQVAYHEIPQPFTLGSMLKDETGSVWALCSAPGKICVFKLSGHEPGNTNYQKSEYIGKPRGKTYVFVYSGEESSYLSWYEKPEDKYKRKYSNLILQLDSSKTLVQSPIHAKDNVNYWFRKKLCWGVIQHPEFSDVQSFSIYNLRTGEEKEINLLCKTQVWNVLSFGDQAVAKTTDGVIIIPLKKDIDLQRLYSWTENEEYDFIYSYNTFKSFIPDSLLVLIGTGEDDHFNILKYLQGSLSTLYMMNFGEVLGYDKTTGTFYLSSYVDGAVSHIKLDVNSGRVTKLKTGKQNMIFARYKEPILYSWEKANVIETTDTVERPIFGWKRFLNKYPDITENMINDLFYWLGTASNYKISKTGYFFRTHHMTFDRGEGSTFWHSDYTGDKPRLEKDEEDLELWLPSFIYDVEADSVILKPNWLRCLQDKEGRTFIAHEKKTKERSYLQVSECKDGKLMEKPNDLKIYGRGKSLPYIDDYRKLVNNNLSIHCADTLFYFQNESWHSISLEKYKKYGAFKNSVMLNGALYLCFDQMLVKHIDDNTHYLYGFKDGLPEQLFGVLSPDNQTILLLTKEGIVRFQEKPFAVKLDLQDGLAAGTEREISLKANRKVSSEYNRVRFVMSLLGSTYPEDGSLFYRLKGLSDQWTKVAFRREILFDKLNPGKYTFEVYARDRHGAKAEIQVLSFRILPPWYQSWWAYLIYAVAGAGLLVALYKWRTYALKARNRELETKVEERTLTLIEQQRKIKESIDYASLIQRSVLPQESELAKAWKEHFVVWKPRDIVGGDLYWLQEIPDSQDYLFAVFDCTGHGVPGALLTMTVNSALSHIVKERHILEPHLILEQLHLEIGAALHQKSDDSMQDGLDISLLRYNPDENKIIFAGAGQHLAVYDNESAQIMVYRGNKYSLGGLRFRERLGFEEQELTFTPGSTIYLFSDGIVDQPDATQENVRRLGSQGWLRLLGEIGSLPLRNQHEQLERLIEQMLANTEQRDDITIVGLRINES